jgi:hypothetical protein
VIAIRTNQPLRLIVWFFHGPKNSDEDYQQYVDSFTKVVVDETLRPAALLYVERNNPMPNAHWRKKIAEASSDLAFRARPRVAFSGPSPLVRGIITAINWLRPPGYDFEVFPTFDAGATWLDQHRRGIKPALVEMMDACAAEAGSSRPP